MRFFTVSENIKTCDDSRDGNCNITKGFAGLSVLSLESRRAPEMAKLIADFRWSATVAPSMREVPIESNPKHKPSHALAYRRIRSADFAHRCGHAGIDARRGNRLLARGFISSLRRVPVVARGPKPTAVLKELEVPVTVTVPEPNTWRELLAALDAKAEALPLRANALPFKNTARPIQNSSPVSRNAELK